MTRPVRARLVLIFSIAMVGSACSSEPELSWEEQTEAGQRALNAGQYAQGEERFQAPLKAADQFPENDRRKADSYDNLAELYKVTSRYPEPIPLREQAWQLREKALGPEHPDATTSLGQFAAACSYAHDHNRAEPPGPGSRDESVAQTLTQLAKTYALQNKFSEAQPAYQRAIELLEKVHGRNHASLAPLLEEQAGVLNKLGKAAQADDLIKRAKAIRGT